MTAAWLLVCIVVVGILARLVGMWFVKSLPTDPEVGAERLPLLDESHTANAPYILPHEHAYAPARPIEQALQIATGLHGVPLVDDV